jgi:hypothetical protein
MVIDCGRYWGPVSDSFICRASRLFCAYDRDDSGSIGVDGFLVMLQMLDPTFEMEDVQKTFAKVGAAETLNEQQFWKWCESVFGDLGHEQYITEMKDLISVTACSLASQCTAMTQIPSPACS